MREEIMRLIAEHGDARINTILTGIPPEKYIYIRDTTDQILAVFSLEISKLKSLSDERLGSVNLGTRGIGIDLWRAIAQAQLDSDRKALLEKLDEKQTSKSVVSLLFLIDVVLDDVLDGQDGHRYI